MSSVAFTFQNPDRARLWTAAQTSYAASFALAAAPASSLVTIASRSPGGNCAKIVERSVSGRTGLLRK